MLAHGSSKITRTSFVTATSHSNLISLRGHGGPCICIGMPICEARWEDVLDAELQLGDLTYREEQGCDDAG